MPVCTTACHLLDCVSYHYISLFYITYIHYISVSSLTLTKHITATPSHPHILSPKNTGTTALLHLHQHCMKPWYCVALSSHIRRTIIEDITILQSTKWVSITIHITNYICTINYFNGSSRINSLTTNRSTSPHYHGPSICHLQCYTTHFGFM